VLAISALKWGFENYPEFEMRTPQGPVRLLSDLRYRSRSGRLFVVPKGEESDLESRPTFLPAFVNWLLGDKLSTAWPALLHDELYHHGPELEPPVTRAEADALYAEALESIGKGWAARNLSWLGLRLGGEFAWSAAREAESKGK
jgi:hypothetical protein